jgi:hypothetical protein
MMSSARLTVQRTAAEGLPVPALLSAGASDLQLEIVHLLLAAGATLAERS